MAETRSNASGQLLLRASLVGVAFILIHLVYNTLLHPLRKVPGPWLASVTGLWRTARHFRGSWLDDIVELHRAYGPVVRIAPNEISFVDEPALKELYGHGKPSVKTSWYDTWVTPGMGINFFSTRDRDQHRHIRGRVSGTYSMSAILAMEDLITEVMDLSLEKMTEVAQGSKPMRLDQFVNYFTFDVVGQIAMGGPIGFLEQQRDVQGIIQSIHDGFYLMSNMGAVPGQMYWIHNQVTRFLLQNFGGVRLNSFRVFLEWLDKRVGERMCNGLGDRRPDMLQYFINGKNPSGSPVSKVEVMQEAGNIIGAGADTTAIAILAVLGNIILKPDAFQRLREEIDDAHDRLDIPSLPFRELEKLPYLAAVVRESMRLHPSITYQLPRHPPPQGMQIREFHIPPSVSCGISPAAMNRSRPLFGEDADEWIPERWLPSNDSEEEAKRLRVMEQNLTTFGMGSRSCIGRNLAVVEVYKYVATFVRHFDASVVNEERPWVTKSQWFSIQRDFWIDLRLRTGRDV